MCDYVAVIGINTGGNECHTGSLEEVQTWVAGYVQDEWEKEFGAPIPESVGENEIDLYFYWAEEGLIVFERGEDGSYSEVPLYPEDESEEEDNG